MATKATSNPQETLIEQKPRDRFYEAIIRKQLPLDIASTLASALHGDLRAQCLMFQSMVDTWPRLQTQIGDMQDAIASHGLEVTPWVRAKEDEATPAAIAKADFVRDALVDMRGSMERNEQSSEDLVRYLVYGYFAPPYVSEVYWDSTGGGILPTSSKTVNPRYYGYPSTGDQPGDELRLFPDGILAGTGDEFPDHKFIIAQRAVYPGHPSIAAPLRALTSWWTAAIFGLEWLMEFSQRFGVPFRWAQVASKPNINEVGRMLDQMGSSGWAAVEGDTQLHFEAATTGAATLPQSVLIEMADKKCDIFITGETLTSDEGDSGSRSLGEVHERQKIKRQKSVSAFVARVLTNQLAPSIVELNFGDASEVPTITIDFPDPRDDKGEAETMAIVINQLKVPLTKEFVYHKLNLEAGKPEEGDEVFEQPKVEVPPMLKPGQKPGDDPPEDEDDETGHEDDEAEAARAKVEAAQNRAAIDDLLENTMANLGNVQSAWLGGARPFFDALIADALNDDLSDEQFVEAVVQAQRAAPDQWDNLDHNALKVALEEAQATATSIGALDRLDEFEVQKREQQQGGN